MSELFLERIPRFLPVLACRDDMPAGAEDLREQPPLAGIVFDRTGSFVPVFTTYGLLSAIAAFAILLIRRRPYETPDESEPAAAPLASATMGATTHGGMHHVGSRLV